MSILLSEPLARRDYAETLEEQLARRQVPDVAGHDPLRIPRNGQFDEVVVGLVPHHLAEGFGMNFEIHHGGNSLNNVAHLHLSAAIRNCEWFEVLLPAGAQKYGLVEDIEVDSEGYVHAPMAPGLGVEIDFDLIERNKTAELR